MKTPYIGYGNDTLQRQPRVKAGDKIQCEHCDQQHVLEDSDTPSILLFYKCGSKSYLAAINGQSIIGTKPDCSGVLETDPAKEPS